MMGVSEGAAVNRALDWMGRGERGREKKEKQFTWIAIVAESLGQVVGWHE